MLIKNCFFLLLLFFISCNDPQPRAEREEEEAIVDQVQEVPEGYTDLSGSKDLEDILCQCWENKEDYEEAKENGIASTFEWVFRGYCFYPDGTLVKYPRGYIEFGTWELIDNGKPFIIRMKPHIEEVEKFKLAKLTPTELVVISPYSGMQTYQSNGLRHKNINKDPLHPVNNQWRIKPDRAESSEEILKRLKGCIHFFVLYYDHMIQTNAEVVTFAGFPSCFTWYAGGIYMQEKNVLQKKWIDCFYSEADAMKAYALAGKLVNKKYEWPKKEKNWMKLNVAVLKQMEMQVDSIN